MCGRSCLTDDDDVTITPLCDCLIFMVVIPRPSPWWGQMGNLQD